eukprot:5803606-Pyramimonas_sp.AAC.2
MAYARGLVPAVAPLLMDDDLRLATTAAAVLGHVAAIGEMREQAGPDTDTVELTIKTLGRLGSGAAVGVNCGCKSHVGSCLVWSLVPEVGCCILVYYHLFWSGGACPSDADARTRRGCVRTTTHCNRQYSEFAGRYSKVTAGERVRGQGTVQRYAAWARFRCGWMRKASVCVG